MKKSSLISIAALAAVSALVLTGCSSNGGGSATTTAKTACVILPDTESSPRWEAGDKPALEKALTGAGYKVDIQNAQGDTAKYATIADQMLSKGCGVMILTDHQGAAVQVAEKAKAQGIPVIAYDRPIKGGSDYYVSFDNEGVGAIEGQCIVDGLKAAGKDAKTASVVYVGGDPADGNAKMFRDGAVKVMEAAGIKAAAETPGTWDGTKAGTAFEQAFTSLSGNVDAVWVANDTNAASVITILDKNGKTVPVSGQDASPAGLQNVLLGKQTCTVYKPFSVEAAAASDLAIKILGGNAPAADKKLADGTPFVAVTPIKVTPTEVQQVVAAGDAKASELCTAAVAEACAKYGVK
jgi:D-xylose transport system substrate-binding protein